MRRNVNLLSSIILATGCFAMLLCSLPAFARERGYIGAQLQQLPTGQVAIIRVKERSPAEQAGLLPGDILLAIDGYVINNLQGFVNYIASSPGKVAQLTIMRNGRYLQGPLRIGGGRKESSAHSLNSSPAQRSGQRELHSPNTSLSRNRDSQITACPANVRQFLSLTSKIRLAYNPIGYDEYSKEGILNKAKTIYADERCKDIRSKVRNQLSFAWETHLKNTLKKREGMDRSSKTSCVLGCIKTVDPGHVCQKGCEKKAAIAKQKRMQKFNAGNKELNRFLEKYEK